MAESAVVDFDDSIMVLAKNNTDIQADIGFLGKLTTNRYVGLIRDGVTGEFVLIDNYALNPSHTNEVDLSNVIAKGNLQVNNLLVDNALAAHTLSVGNTFVLPKGTAAQRPASPQEGQMWFNTETKMFEGWDGTAWQVFVPAQLNSIE
jgi:hypothetical protein